MARAERSRQSSRRERSGPAALVAWLSRPLASFHLILATCGLLTTVGIVMVLSASSVESYSMGQASSVYALFEQHLMSIAVGAVGFYVTLRMPIRLLRSLSPAGIVIALGLLMLVLTPLGYASNGSQGWFKLGPLSLQPVELAKLALALWGAHILVTKYNMLHQWRHLLVPLLPAALLMFALVMAQPDLGGTVTLAVVLLALLFFAGAPKKLFGVILAGALAGTVVLGIVADYRLDRILSFLGLSDSEANSYQATQALYALADGGLFGEGLGQGAAKWDYLPNIYHDFIFALIGEELGLVGCLAVVGLYVLLTVVGLRIAARNLDPWIRIVSGTLTVWLVIQAAINIGYVVRLLPVTGVTLPLISYGGTSMVVTMLMFGILANCARHEPEAVAALHTQGPGKFGRLLRLPAPEPYHPPTTRTRKTPTTGSGQRTQQSRGRQRREPAEYGQRSRPRTGGRQRAGNVRATRKGPR